MKKLKTARSLALGISASIIFFTILPALTLLGASDQATVTVSWTIKPFQSLSIVGKYSNSKSVVSTYNLPSPRDVDLKRGYIKERNALTFLAVSNVDWEINVRALSPSMGTSSEGNYTKPLDHFQLRANNERYLTITNADQVLTSGEHGEHRVGIDYKVKFDEERYREGNYKIKLLYTITTK